MKWFSFVPDFRSFLTNHRLERTGLIAPRAYHRSFLLHLSNTWNERELTETIKNFHNDPTPLIRQAQPLDVNGASLQQPAFQYLDDEENAT